MNDVSEFFERAYQSNFKSKDWWVVVSYAGSSIFYFFPWFSEIIYGASQMTPFGFYGWMRKNFTWMGIWEPEARGLGIMALILLILSILGMASVIVAIVGVIKRKPPIPYGIAAPVVTAAMLIITLCISGEMRSSYDAWEFYANLWIPILSLTSSIPAFAVYQLSHGRTIQPTYVRTGGIRPISGEYAGVKFKLTDGETLMLGRDPALCNIVFRDKNISRRHCAVRYSAAQDRYYVMDLSKNGTFLENGVRLRPQAEMALERGSKIYLMNQNNMLTLE